MYLDQVKTLYNFKGDVIRNTPIMGREHELSDLADDDFDMNVAKKIITRDKEAKFNKTQYHAIDYAFNHVPFFKSRFSDGGHPVWYGSLDVETTFHETVFHWYNRIIADINYNDAKPIVTNRSLFRVGCSSMLLDLRPHVKKIPEIIGESFDAYNVTQVLGKEIHNQGLPGIYTYSARKQAGENVAIYNRKSLSGTEHLDNVKYIYDFQKSLISVLDGKTGKTLTEIKG